MADQDITGRDQYFYTRLNKGINNTFSRSSSDIADMYKVSLQYLFDPELVFVNASNSTFINSPPPQEITRHISHTGPLMALQMLCLGKPPLTISTLLRQ